MTVMIFSMYAVMTAYLLIFVAGFYARNNAMGSLLEANPGYFFFFFMFGLFLIYLGELYIISLNHPHEDKMIKSKIELLREQNKINK